MAAIPPDEQALSDDGVTQISRINDPDQPGRTLIRCRFLGPDAATRLRREETVFRSLAGVPGVAQCRKTIPERNVMIFDDHDGTVLAERISRRGFTVLQVIQLGVKVARILADIHRAGVVHRNINPASILVFSEDDDPIIIEFGLAMMTGDDITKDITGWVRDLAYLAPEQTGRTGRPVDHRVDLYGLGATLYTLLHGSPPFSDVAENRLALIHAHLAREVTPLDSIHPEIPAELSAVVARLLRKDPDERYQSAEGAAFDLAVIADLLDAESTEPPFTLGEHDFPLRVSAPSRLVGRHDQVAVLRTALARAQREGAGGLLVTGSSGVGKSALLSQLRPMVTAVGGWFIAGKFDQYRSGPEPDAVEHVVRMLARQVLAEPEDHLSGHRSRLSEALGPLSRWLARYPELRTLLDVEPQPPDVDPAESTSRLRQAMVTFLRTLPTPRRPVVLVLDDLQWSTAYPLGVLDALLTAGPVPGLLVVGAFRDQESDPNPPLTRLVEKWTRTGAVTTLHLDTMSGADLSAFLAAVIRLPPEQADQLAAVVMPQTHGNPFDTIELVNAFRQDGVLQLARSGWTWDNETIRTYVGEHKVADLLKQRIDALPPPTRQVLRVLAALGGPVDLGQLGVAAALPPEKLLSLLEPALWDRLVVLQGPDGTSVEDTVWFRHNRVQYVVYTWDGADGDPRLHLALARRLAARSQHAGAAAEQYLEALPLVREPVELRRATELFLWVAEATHLADATVADRYLDAAEEALSVLQIPDDDPLTMAVLRLRHAVLYTLGRLEDADEFYRQIIDRDVPPGNHLDSDCLHLSSLTDRRRYAEAVSLGMHLLIEVGMPVPPRERMLREIADGLAEMQRWSSTDPPADEDPAPLIDRDQVVATLVLNRLTNAALYNGDSTLHAWLVIQAFRMWVEQGPHPNLIGPIAGCGTVAAGRLGDHKLSYRIMKRVLPFAETHGFEPGTSQAKFLFALFTTNWVSSVEDTTELFIQSRDGCLRGGDLHNASYASTYLSTSTIHFAPTLEVVELALAESRAFVVGTGNDSALVNFPAYEQLVRALRGVTSTEGGFTDEEFDEESFAQIIETEVAKVSYHTYRALSALIFDDPDMLRRHAELALEGALAVPAVFTNFLARVMYGLSAAIELRRGVSADKAAELLDELDEHRTWATARAKDSPRNFAPLAHLLEAERARAVGDRQAAAADYDAALRIVAPLPRPWNHALISERAADFYLGQGLSHLGRALLAEAYQAYSSWGARGKVRQLETRFPFLRSRSIPWGPRTDKDSAAGYAPGTVRATRLTSIDLLAILKVSQELATETDLGKLRDQVTEVLSMVTGAEQVRLALWNDELQNWQFPVSGAPSSPSVADHDGRPLLLTPDQAADRGLLALTAFQYAERTQEPLIVEDATTDDRFFRDPYVQRLDHCSLLIVPVLARGIPRALLLLENRLAAGAFSPDLVDITLMVAGQLAMAMDNALADRFRSLVQRSSDLTLVCDPRGEITYASTASVELLGLSQSSLLGTDVVDLFHDEDRETVRQWLASLRDRQDALVVTRSRVVPEPDSPGDERRPEGRSPTTSWVELTGTDLTDDPAVGGSMLRLRDVTDRRRLENELHQAQRLESVGRLAAGVAHELNTPIQYIQDNVTFLQEAFIGLRNALPPGTSRTTTRVAELLEEVPQALSETLDGARRMASIVQTMNAFRNLDGGIFAATDLNTTIRHVLALATDELRGVAEVHLELDPDLPHVVCRAVEINQALLNIIVNAAQSMVEKRQITGQLGTLTVRTYGEGEKVTIEIEDTGHGIPAEIADLVFDQFFSTRPVGSGTGQGLFLAHTVIHDHHGGSITFESTTGKGTTFTVRLPVFQQTPGPAEDPSPRSAEQATSPLVS
jgi:PAS domain S-box-containing protein